MRTDRDFWPQSIPLSAPIKFCRAAGFSPGGTPSSNEHDDIGNRARRSLKRAGLIGEHKKLAAIEACWCRRANRKAHSPPFTNCHTGASFILQTILVADNRSRFEGFTTKCVYAVTKLRPLHPRKLSCLVTRYWQVQSKRRDRPRPQKQT